MWKRGCSTPSTMLCPDHAVHYDMSVLTLPFFSLEEFLLYLYILAIRHQSASSLFLLVCINYIYNSRFTTTVHTCCCYILIFPFIIPSSSYTFTDPHLNLPPFYFHVFIFCDPGLLKFLPQGRYKWRLPLLLRSQQPREACFFQRSLWRNDKLN